MEVLPHQDHRDGQGHVPKGRRQQEGLGSQVSGLVQSQTTHQCPKDRTSD